MRDWENRKGERGNEEIADAVSGRLENSFAPVDSEVDSDARKHLLTGA